MSASSLNSMPAVFHFRVSGMSFASCVSRVEKALGQVNGVLEVSVNLAMEETLVKGTEGLMLYTLLDAVNKAGYEVLTATHQAQVEGLSCASCVGRVEKAFGVPRI